MKRHINLFLLIIFIIFTYGCGVKYQFEKAQEKEIKGEYTEAIESYKIILQKYPNKKESIESALRIATIYQDKLNDLELALRYYRIFLEKANTTDCRIPEVKLKVADIEFNKTKNILLYKERLEEIIKNHSTSEFVNIAQQKLTEINKLEEELKSCKKEAENFLEKGNYKEAVDNYKKWLTYFPDDKEVLSKLEEAESKEKFEEMKIKALNVYDKKYYPVWNFSVTLAEYIYNSLIKVGKDEIYEDEFEEHEVKKKIEKCYEDAKNIIEKNIFYIKLKINKEHKLSVQYDFDLRHLNVSFEFQKVELGRSRAPIFFDRPIKFFTSLKMEESEAKFLKRKLLENGLECHIFFKINGIKENPNYYKELEYWRMFIGTGLLLYTPKEFVLDGGVLLAKINLLGKDFYLKL